MANDKTNAMRLLDKAKISYKIHTYDHSDGLIDGIAVAEKIGQSEEQVYKTLIAQGTSREYYVFIIPVTKELELKKAAKAVGEKSIEMIKVSDINKVTGYIRGGCSPIGMKKKYQTVIDLSSQGLDTIIISAGKIGHQIQIKPMDLMAFIGCKIENISVEKLIL